MILLARPLRTGELERLHRHRYVVVPDWLTRAQTGRLQADAVAVDADSGFESAVGNAPGPAALDRFRTSSVIGRVSRYIGSVNFGTARVDNEVRRSRQCSIYPPPRNAAGSVTERDGLVSAVNGLRRELEVCAIEHCLAAILTRPRRFSSSQTRSTLATDQRRHPTVVRQAAALPALPRLAPFETELNYLLYPIGGHYKRRADPAAVGRALLRSAPSVIGPPLACR